MAINITKDLEGVLLQYEMAVTNYHFEHPELKDPHVIAAYTAAMNFFARRKKKLPELPVMLTGHALELFELLKKITEKMLKEPEPDESAQIHTTVEKVIIVLKRLKESVEMWHKERGIKGYINFIAPFTGGAIGLERV